MGILWSKVPVDTATHLAQENHRVSELSLADGADGARFCALLSCGSDPIILREEEGEGRQTA